MTFSLQCNKIIDKYLLDNNVLYKYRNCIGVLVALISAEYISFGKNKLLNKFIVPICLYVVSLYAIEVLCRLLINKKDRVELKEKCMLWVNDPENKKKRTKDKLFILNFDEIKNYNKTIENFEVRENLENEVKNLENELKDKLHKKKVNDLVKKVLEPKSTTYRGLPNPPPIPGPQWIPDTAKEVQDRLNNGMYVKSLCPYKM